MTVDIEKIRGGIHSDLQDWLDFNRTGAFAVPNGLDYVAPFPPPELMFHTTALNRPEDFAGHGCDVLKALSLASPTPLNTFTSILDFGVGVGRLARMFKGFRGRYAGVDVERKNVSWVASALGYVEAVASSPKREVPFPARAFDCIISISVFTHMNMRDQLFYLGELARLAKPGATLLLTVHGERALARAEQESRIFEMLAVPRESIQATRGLFPLPGFSFIPQYSDFAAAPEAGARGLLSALYRRLSANRYEYGITFISEAYIRREWAKHFDVVGFCPAAIHDFQDIVVLKAR